MENILIIIAGTALILYLAYGLYRNIAMIRLSVIARDRSAIAIAISATVILAAGIVAIAAFIDSRLPYHYLSALYPMKVVLRPFMSAAVTVMMIVLDITVVRSLIGSIMTKDRKAIIIDSIRTLAAIALTVYLVSGRWQWLFN